MNCYTPKSRLFTCLFFPPQDGRASLTEISERGRSRGEINSILLFIIFFSARIVSSITCVSSLDSPSGWFFVVIFFSQTAEAERRRRRGRRRKKREQRSECSWRAIRWSVFIGGGDGGIAWVPSTIGSSPCVDDTCDSS